MLQFVLGRAGSGKTEYVRRLLADRARAGEGPSMLLVPEQYTFETEKAMLRLAGPVGGNAIPVYSFTRLAEAVFRREGGAVGRRLTEGGRRILMARAVEALSPRRISEDIEVGGVAAALVTDKGHVYRGICIDTACSMGFCAEHAAIAAMLTAGEDRVEQIVAVDWARRILPPCGRCREFLLQLGNPNAQVLVAKDTAVPVKELLPWSWQEAREQPEQA